MNALTLGALSTGDLTVMSSGALNLGSGTVTGTLDATVQRRQHHEDRNGELDRGHNRQLGADWYANKPSITVGNASSNVVFNGVGVTALAVQATGAAQSAVGSQVAAINAEQLTDTFGTDSVAEQVDYGFAGDVGTTPPMDHRLEDTGISVPSCFNESREGTACK
ncbi:MAG TPA: hypothetical protein VET51_08850 [Burkholderiales bacterium]|nr:hypothetical protein [Burkholderiales bacterium]